MNEKDKALIDKAWKTSCFRWTEIESLIEQAESQQAKDELEEIMKFKNHQEEQKCGLD